MRRSLSHVALTLGVIVGLCSMGAPVSASIYQADVVSDTAASATPNLVTSTAVPHPHVDAVALSGQTMYAGGFFDAVSDSTRSYPRHNLVAFDASTGVVKSLFAPVFDGDVWAIATTPGAAYVGGAFTTVSGVARPALVKLDPSTGAVDLSFNARFHGGQVNELRLWNGALVVGGSSGSKLMALDPATGETSARSTSGSRVPGAWGNVYVYAFAINPAGTRLVATGNFETVDGKARTRLFVADLNYSPARLDPWYYPGFAKPCSSTAPRRVAYLQGVDFSPDGRYFIVTATGQVPKYKTDIWHSGVRIHPTRLSVTPQDGSTCPAPAPPRGSTTPVATASGPHRPPELPYTFRDTSSGWTTPTDTPASAWGQPSPGKELGRSTQPPAKPCFGIPANPQAGR